MIIKYRCYDKKLKKLRAPDLDNRVSWFAVEPHNAIRLLADDRYELLLWTGFEDKNGVDVYPGDILDDKYIVNWDILNGRWGLYIGDEFKYSFSTYNPSQHEITGSIY